jgi:hypothetical protein
MISGLAELANCRIGRAKGQGDFADRARADMAQQAFLQHFEILLTSEKDGSKHDGVVVKFIACGKDQCHGAPARPGAELSEFVQVATQLSRIATTELRPARRIVIEPFAQRRTRRNVLDPVFDRGIGFPDSARPQPIDQYARSVLRGSG